MTETSEVMDRYLDAPRNGRDLAGRRTRLTQPGVPQQRAGDRSGRVAGAVDTVPAER